MRCFRLCEIFIGSTCVIKFLKFKKKFRKLFYLVPVVLSFSCGVQGSFAKVHLWEHYILLAVHVCVVGILNTTFLQDIWGIYMHPL